MIPSILTCLLTTLSIRHTKPGGWVEFQDWDIQYRTNDNSLSKDSALWKWDNYIIDACQKIGRTARPGPELKKWVTDAGFENVHHKVFVLPFGPWPKDKKLVRADYLTGIPVRLT